MESYPFLCRKIPDRLCRQYEELLREAQLRDEGNWEQTVLMLDDDDNILACGSLGGRVLRQIAVSEKASGLGLCATVVSELVSSAAAEGKTKLFLFTKPKHLSMFSSLGFYPITQTSEILMMENSRNGLNLFLKSVPNVCGKVGAVVCNCNPFTLGHRHLIETAASECDEVLVFVLSANRGLIPAEDRIELVRCGCADLPNVHVVPGGDYILSPETFPTYFIKEQDRTAKAQCELDVALFGLRIAPALGIKKRYLGEEPFDPITAQYNDYMKKALPESGIELKVIPRFNNISASYVRKMLLDGRVGEVRELLPRCTYEYCLRRFGDCSEIQR